VEESNCAVIVTAFQRTSHSGSPWQRRRRCGFKVAKCDLSAVTKPGFSRGYDRILKRNRTTGCSDPHSRVFPSSANGFQLPSLVALGLTAQTTGWPGLRALLDRVSFCSKYYRVPAGEDHGAVPR
jgi:hypothetical protein